MLGKFTVRMIQEFPHLLFRDRYMRYQMLQWEFCHATPVLKIHRHRHVIFSSAMKITFQETSESMISALQCVHNECEGRISLSS